MKKDFLLNFVEELRVPYIRRKTLRDSFTSVFVFLRQYFLSIREKL